MKDIDTNVYGNIDARACLPRGTTHIRREEYEPIRKVHGVGEWAKHSVNIQDGCEHDCRYCYAKSMAIRFRRKTPQNWKLPALRRDDVEKNYRRRSGRIMYPTSHDISTGNIDESICVLGKMLEAGNEVLIVSKPHLDCIKQICSEFGRYREQIIFRFTIGSADDSTLRFWEPGAPSFAERLESLKWAYRHGFRTSVSCEPMLDTRIDKVIKAVKPDVTDTIWLGRANRVMPIIAINCPGDTKVKRLAGQLLADQTDDYLRELYDHYKSDPIIKFKDSIKAVVGLKRPVERGLDI